MKSTWPIAMAHRVGLSGAIAFTPSRVGMTLHIPCRKGRHLVDFEVEPGLHPDFVAKRMLGKGWTFGSKLACPTCSTSEKRHRKPKGEPPMNTQPALVNGASAAPLPDPAPMSDGAKRAHRLVMQALEDAYDENAKAYRDGWNDERIARDTGASEASVRKTREEFFGPIGEPAVVREIKESLAQLCRQHDAMAQSFKRQADDLRNKLAAVCKANGWPAPV